jgi:hypothetical protein
MVPSSFLCPPAGLVTGCLGSPAPVRLAKLARRADSSHPPPADARSSRLQARNTSIISANMMASPPIHITAPPECRSLTALGAQEGRGLMSAIGVFE